MSTYRKLPVTRMAVNHKFQVGTFKGYLTVGLFDDGQPGEIFVKSSKDGSSDFGGLLGCLAMTASMALQRGTPLEDLCRKWKYTRFEPSGPTGNPDIPLASSIADYLGKWLELQFTDKKSTKEKK